MSGQTYSWWSLFKNGLSHHRTWEPAWTRRPLQSGYDVVIIGGGGHGLATAYYLAKNHKAGRIAVLGLGGTEGTHFSGDCHLRVDRPASIWRRP